MPFFTLRDGRIHTTKLEYNLTEHCNYSCEECGQLAPYNAVRFGDLSNFERDINALTEVYHTRRFRLVGGEPLLHTRVADFAAIARSSGIADRIQIVTNGVLLHKMNPAVLAHVDIVTVSHYPDPRCDEAKIRTARALCRQHGTRLQVRPIDSFRRMTLAEANEDAALVESIFRSCQLAHSWHCQTFYDGSFYLCSRPIFTRGYLRHFDASAPDLQAIDGVPIHGENLLERLIRALSSDTPLASCHYCLGTVGRTIPWRQLTRAESTQPTRSTLPLTETINTSKLQALLRWARIEKSILGRLSSLSLFRWLSIVKTALVRD